MVILSVTCFINNTIDSGNRCDESSWIDVDHGLICGDCKVLADEMKRHRTCNGYCEANKLHCKAAWEEESDSCSIKREEKCDFDFGNETTDAICECGKSRRGINIIVLKRGIK